MSKYEKFWNYYHQVKNPQLKKVISKSWHSLNYQIESTGIPGARYAVSLTKTGMIVQLELKEKTTHSSPELLKSLRQHLTSNYSNICNDFGEDLELIEGKTSFAIRKSIENESALKNEGCWTTLVDDTIFFLELLKRSTKPYLIKSPPTTNQGLLSPSNNPEAFQQSNNQNFCSEGQF